jgi:hypothetical protein
MALGDDFGSSIAAAIASPKQSIMSLNWPIEIAQRANESAKKIRPWRDDFCHHETIYFLIN